MCGLTNTHPGGALTHASTLLLLNLEGPCSHAERKVKESQEEGRQVRDC